MESKKLTTVPNKTLMKINIELKETSILFPLDDTKSKTKILRYKFNSFCRIDIDNEFDTIIDGYNRLLRINYKSKNLKLSAKFLDIEFSIVNCRNGTYSIDNICDRMIQVFRFQVNLNSFLLIPNKNKLVMAININCEPLIFNIGFRQTKAIIKFLPKLTEFLGEMNKEYQDPIKELEKEDDNIKNIDENDNENKIIINIDNENNSNRINSEVSFLSDISEDQEDKRKEMEKKLAEQYKIKMMIKKRFKNRKSK